MNASDSTGELREVLLRPEAYSRRGLPGWTGAVGFVETHISLLFFAGERVYKVKKPVDLGFLDFTTPALRKHFCEEEVRLNRRLAPATYLGVAPIVRDVDGLRLAAPGPDDANLEVVDWAVEMVRLPEERMLSHLVDEGGIDNDLMNRLADLLVAFHAAAPTGADVDEHGSPEAIAANARENFEQTRPFVAQHGGHAESGVCTLSPALHMFLAARSEVFLRDHAELFEERVRAGRIREGHGDLHAGNICCPREGRGNGGEAGRAPPPVAYDCIEFNRRFRCGDVAADLAFLAMDLDYRGASGFGGYLVHRYASTAPDPELGRLLPYYKAYRAVVRGKVASMRAAGLPESSGDEREVARREAMRYFQLAACYDLPPALVLTCGLPATGKTFVARALARPLHAVFLRSDVRRKVLAGVPLTHREAADWCSGLYDPGHTEHVYRSLLETAADALRAGRSAVVDATFSTRAERERFRDAAVRLGAECFVVHVTASDALVRERMARRAADPDEVSDADIAVHERARSSFEPPDEVAPGRRIEHPSQSEPIEQAAAALIDRMIAGASVAHTPS